MGLGIRYDVILAFALGLLLLYLAGWLLLVPLKMILKLILNGIAGGVMLYLGNLLGAGVGLYIAINPITALTVGLLGVPGYVLLVILKFVLS